MATATNNQSTPSFVLVGHFQQRYVAGIKCRPSKCKTCKHSIHPALSSPQSNTWIPLTNSTDNYSLSVLQHKFRVPGSSFSSMFLKSADADLGHMFWVNVEGLSVIKINSFSSSANIVLIAPSF